MATPVLVTGTGAARAVPGEPQGHGGQPASERLRGWLAQAGGATDGFWRRVADAGTPVLEPVDGGRALLASFVWRGAATQEVQMFWPIRRHDRDSFTRLPGTDLWHYALRLPTDAHLSYQLAPDVPRLPLADRLTQRRAILQVAQADPLNPRRWPLHGDAVVQPAHSLLLGPDAPALPDSAPVPADQRGTVRTLTWHSQRLANTRTLTLYLPAAGLQAQPAGRTAQALPWLLLFDRDPWLQRVPTPALLDRLIMQGRVPPLAAVLVGHPTPAHRATELPCNPAFADALARELVPWLRQQAPLTADPARTVVAGASYGGLAAAWLGWRHPQVFGRVLSLSGSFWWSPQATPALGASPLDDRREASWFTRQVAEQAWPQAPDLHWVLSAGLFERSAPDDGPGILETNRHLRDVLRARGLRLSHREFAGGHDHLAWQRELLEGLALLLPADRGTPT